MDRRSVALWSVCLAVVAVVVFSPAVGSAGKPGSGSATGTGRVFLPNPVAALQNQNLTDEKDADYPALQPAYRIVTLTNLDGSGFLAGDWANVVSETGDPSRKTTPSSTAATTTASSRSWATSG